jgi:uncharacterized protein
MTAPGFERIPPAPGPLVQGFAGRGFVVDGVTYQGVLLTPLAASAWDAPDLADLSAEQLALVAALDPPPEFLIVGTGAVTRFPPRAFIAALDAKGIGVEAMDSRAAARTWGLLRGEGRWIAAALMPV